ncbi:MAG TPA: winged helix-turn-helix domain-containing protein, partial [Candidatus Eremiobacteraceae bacterium]
MPATVPIGRLRFDPERFVLYDGTEIVPLAPLPAQMLAELVRADGELVDAASLRQSLWGDSAVEERNLNQQMYILRRALRRDPHISIENVPRRGYRIVVTPVVIAASIQARPRVSFIGAFAALAIGSAIIAASARVPALAPSPPSVDRDLALASYLSTSEGPSHLADAARYYRALIAKAPNGAAGYGGLAFVDAKIAIGSTGETRSRWFDAARTEAAEGLRRDPNESNALTALGIIASVDEHRDDIAKRMFDAAVAADPTAESPRAWRGKFRLSIGDFNEAGCDFKTVSIDVPTSGSAVGLYGEWLVLDRDYVGASAVLSQALDLGYHPGFTRYWLARSYYQRGLDAQALRLSNEILALYPGEASALALRLRVETSLGDKKGALADLEQIEKISDPNRVDP